MNVRHFVAQLTPGGNPVAHGLNLPRAHPTTELRPTTSRTGPSGCAPYTRRVQCHYFDATQCRSCNLMGMPLATQIVRKQEQVAQTLSAHIPAPAWLPPATSPETHFRNKAKLAVGGTTDEPTLGLHFPGAPSVDLRECGIHAEAIWDVIPDLAGFVTLTGLTPYDPDADTGQLKLIHVTAAPTGHLMVRFVVRSPADISPIRTALSALQRRLPQLAVASVNVLPERRAALAGDHEVVLTNGSHLAMPLELPGRQLTLAVQTHSFFQTNTTVATALYTQAAEWATSVNPQTVVDVYCGVGGFALAVAEPGRQVRGLEVEPSAIECARRARITPHPITPTPSSGATPATDAPHDVTFEVADGTELTTADVAADLVIVNPPRRGIGPLAQTLNSSASQHVIYSSCHPASLAADLDVLNGFEVRAARLFDMFPHTDHCEVAVLLARR